jgi:hypothetical protein
MRRVNLDHRVRPGWAAYHRYLPALLAFCLLALSSGPATAHAVAEGDAGYIQEITGIDLLPLDAP